VKRFLLVFCITAVVAIALFFIDKYLMEIHFFVLAIACVAAGTVSNLVFDAKQKKDGNKK